MEDQSDCSSMPAHVVWSDREGHGAPAYVFVGERRSSRAIALGVHWEDGRLAARTLHDALRALGLDPARQTYVNLFCETDPRAVDADILASIHRYDRAGVTIVAMGRPVQAVLTRAGVAHLRLIHPAARGSIRARSAYQAHVAAVLGSPRISREDIDGSIRRRD